MDTGLLGADCSREFKSMATLVLVVGAVLKIPKSSNPEDRSLPGLAGGLKVSSDKSPRRLFSVCFEETAFTCV